jgi:trigger factor
MAAKEIENKGLKRSYEVEISAKDLEKMTNTRLGEIAKTVNLKGFRKGKAPLNVVKAQYGEAIMGEVVEKAVNSESQKLLAEKKIRPAMQPKIEITSFAKGDPLKFKMEVEILPEFEVMDIKKLKLTKPVADVEDAMLEDALQRIAKQNTDTQPVKAKRAAKLGDVTVIDFDGKVDGERRDGMKAEGHNLELGSGMFIPGFEDQLVGKKAGDELQVKVTFPENYGAAELAGKDAVFDVKIHELREAVDAELNDDLAKKLGMEDLDALKNILREQMQSEYGQHSRMKLKRDLLDQLDEGHTFDLPERMIEQEYEMIEKQIEQERHQQMHAEGNHDHDCKESHIDDSEKEELKDIAKRRVKLGLVLSEIGTKNNVKVGDQDLQQAVMAEARKYPGQEAQVFEFYQKNQQALESLRAPLFEEKVCDYIFELADVKETKVSLDELTAAEDEGTKSAKKKPATKKKATPKKETTKKTDAKKPAAKKALAKKAASKAKK